MSTLRVGCAIAETVRFRYVAEEEFDCFSEAGNERTTRMPHLFPCAGRVEIPPILTHSTILCFRGSVDHYKKKWQKQDMKKSMQEFDSMLKLFLFRV